MALGDQYPHLAFERIATITDPDVRFVDVAGSVYVNSSHYIAVRHAPLAMDMVPVVYINCVKIRLTLFPIGNLMCVRRISATQTMLKNLSSEMHLVEIKEEYESFNDSADAAIGHGIIGVNFRVG